MVCKGITQGKGFVVMARFSILISLVTLLSVNLLTASKSQAQEKEFTVFDVRKTLPLNDEQKVFKDYYVNIGSESGVKAGTILEVYRKVPVIDIYRNKAQGDLVIPVAHLRVIQSQKTMSVARVETVANPKDIPVVQFEAVMMGDRVQVASTKVDIKVDNAAQVNTTSDDEEEGEE